MKFSLIIPCYNEAANLPLLLGHCAKIGSDPNIEIILVDNGSTDHTQNILQTLLPHYPGCRSIRVEHNQGYGFGILAGLAAAKGDVLGWTHADMQTDPADILQAIPLFQHHGKNIFVKGKRCGRPFSDSIFTIGMSIFETFLLRQPMWDINAQPTLFSRSFYESWHQVPHDFSLDLYVYYKARQSRLTIYRFPVLFGKRANGVSHWNINWAAKYKFIHRTITFSLHLKRSLKT